MKLEDIKAADSKTTLLQFILAQLAKSAPQLIKFYEDLPTLEPASKTALQNIVSDLSSVKKDAEASSRFLENIKLKESIPTLTNFVSKVKGSIEIAEKNFSEMEETYKAAVTYLGEESRLQPEEFFGMINQFVSAVQVHTLLAFIILRPLRMVSNGMNKQLSSTKNKNSERLQDKTV
jgi:hypothetical protein